MARVLLLLVFSLSSLYFCNALTCEGENFLGLTTYVTCPRPFNKKEDVFCCGDKHNIVCCDNPLGLDEEDFEKLASKLPAILGTIVAIAISLIILCIVCCCCCPFCLLYKRRSRGAVHNPAQPATQMQPQPGYAPVMASSYPNQTTQPFMAQPQPGYAPPPQGYGMPPQPGYAPPLSSNAPYPISQAPYPTATPAGPNEQPPPYAEKQMPFNPNY